MAIGRKILRALVHLRRAVRKARSLRLPRPAKFPNIAPARGALSGVRAFFTGRNLLRQSLRSLRRHIKSLPAKKSAGKPGFASWKEAEDWTQRQLDEAFGKPPAATPPQQQQPHAPAPPTPAPPQQLHAPAPSRPPVARRLPESPFLENPYAPKGPVPPAPPTPTAEQAEGARATERKFKERLRQRALAAAKAPPARSLPAPTTEAGAREAAAKALRSLPIPSAERRTPPAKVGRKALPKSAGKRRLVPWQGWRSQVRDEGGRWTGQQWEDESGAGGRRTDDLRESIDKLTEQMKTLTDAIKEAKEGRQGAPTQEGGGPAAGAAKAVEAAAGGGEKKEGGGSEAMDLMKLFAELMGAV